MRYASVCSGVEAASLAWMPLGWEPIWFSEIEPFPCEVLKQRFPGVQNLGDMTKIIGEKYRGTVDLLVGGTPCQGFSVAGKQGGLGDPRSALCLAYCRLLETMRPRWFVWENVPGVFSTNGGEDFRAFLRKIDEIGYSCAWRVLDAQYVRVDGYPRAVPQRRRRVFVVGYLGEWQYPAEVLFEPGCLHRDSPPRREAGTGVARSVTASTGGASGKEQQHTFVGIGGKPLNALGVDGYNGAISGSVSATVDTRCKNANRPTLVMAHGQANAEISEAVSPALPCDHEAPIAFRWAASPSQGLPIGVDCCHTLMANRNGEPAVCYENHAQDSRIREIDCAPVLSAKAGTGGGNLPLVASFMVGQGSRAGGIAFSESAAPTLKAAMSGNGIGAQEDLAYTQNATGVMGVAYNVKEEGEFQDGNAAKINAGKVLLLLRKEIGKDTFRKWASGRLIRISEKEILQSNLHVKGFRQKTCQGQSAMDDSTLPCEEVTSENALLYLWSDFQSRYSSYRRELAQQFLDELDVCLQKLSLETPQKFKPIVRRLLPIETERLMGFPDNWTRIPWRGKQAEECPDSPRYKACGNSMCVNVMRWIGMRIENVERKMR